MKLILIFALMMVIPFSQASFGQKAGKKITITGVVTDTKQKPVEGATIFVDKVKTSSTTNHKGFYKVKVAPNAKEILVFSGTNGTTQTVINGQTSINFVLAEQPSEPAANLNDENEELVNIGYGSIKKKEITTSVSTIDGQQSKFAGYQTIYDIIRGRFSGVEVNGNKIRIRGINSLNLSTEPLFVVDGMIVSSIEHISPQSVKSIEILKDASASIYGTQGANGVILITLLRGPDEKKKR